MIVEPIPMPSLDPEIKRFTARMLSTRSRYLHVVLLLAALIMCILLGALLATEPALIVRTQIALAVMLGIGICWALYALWVLARRRPLLGVQRIVAGWMAVAFTGLFVAAAAAMYVANGEAIHLAATGSGSVMLALSIAILVRAHRHVARLQARRRELECQATPS